MLRNDNFMSQFLLNIESNIVHNLTQYCNICMCWELTRSYYHIQFNPNICQSDWVVFLCFQKSLFCIAAILNLGVFSN